MIFIHRGAPGDIASANGAQLRQVGHGYMELDDGSRVPLHRVVEVRVRSQVVWKRDDR